LVTENSPSKNKIPIRGLVGFLSLGYWLLLNCHVYSQPNLTIVEEGHLKTAQEYLAEGKTQEAVNILEELLAQHSSQLKIMMLLAVALQKLPQPDLHRAKTLLCQADRLTPQNADVHLLLGQLYSKTKNESLALSEFKRTLSLSRDPATLVPAHLGLMAIYQRRKQTAEAQQEYNAAIKLAPEIKDIIQQEEIRQVTPAPVFVGGEGGTHPMLEERIKRLQQKRGR
jgi:Tfp pilus assembly protein PilF